MKTVTELICPNCLREIPPSAPLGLCPACLIESVLDLEEEGGSGDPSVNGEVAEPGLPEIPGFRLLREIGEGGFSRVYAAEQLGKVRRRVAIKILKEEVATRQGRARFEGEIRALASLNHPHIAQVYSAGQTGDGYPFIVMEEVAGVPVTTHCAECGLSLSERLDLFVKVCAAVQHAHERGIIHRDLKPSNVLVSREEGQPKVIDFGVAKAITSAEPLSIEACTVAFQLMGTPSYMSPEQTELSCPRSDVRSDVFSLGSLFYELIAGRSPFPQRDTLEKTLASVREDHPTGPATVMRRSGNSRGDHFLVPFFWKELDWIAAKAMEKDPGERYRSAGDLGDDVRRHLQGRPIRAEAPNRLVEVLRFIHRHWLVCTLGTGLILTLSAGLGATLISYEAAERARELEARMARQLLAAQIDLRDRFVRGENDLAHEYGGRALTGRAIAHLCRALREKPGDQGTYASLMQYLMSGRFVHPSMPAVQADPRLARDRRLIAGQAGNAFGLLGRDTKGSWWLQHDEKVWQLPARDDHEIADAALTASGRWLAVCWEDGTIGTVDTATGRAGASFRSAPEAGPVLAAPREEVIFFPSGPRRLSRRSVGATGLPGTDADLPGRIRTFTLSWDGSRIAVTLEEGGAVLLDGRTLQILDHLPPGDAAFGLVALGSGGRRVALAARDGRRISVWKPGSATPEVERIEAEAPVRFLGLSGSSKFLRIGFSNGHSAVWEVRPTIREITAVPTYPVSPARSMLEMASGTLIARESHIARESGTMRLMTYYSGPQSGLLLPHRGTVENLAMSADRSTVFVLSGSGQVSGWKLESAPPVPVIPTAVTQDGSADEEIVRIATDPGNRVVRIVHRGGHVAGWDLKGLKRLPGRQVLSESDGPVRDVVWPGDGEDWVAASLHVVGRGTDGLKWPLPLKALRMADLRRDGTALAFIDAGGDVRVFGIPAPGEEGQLAALLHWKPPSAVSAMAWDEARGRLWIALTEDEIVGLAPGNPEEPLLRIPLTRSARTLAVTPDGRHLALGTTDRMVCLFRLGERRGPVKVWANSFGTTPVFLAIDPGGRRVVAVNGSGRSQAWDGPSGLPIGPRTNFGGTVKAVSFSGDGRYLFVGFANGNTRIRGFPDPRSPAPPWFLDLAECLGGWRIDSGGALERWLPENVPPAEIPPGAEGEAADYARWLTTPMPDRAVFPATGSLTWGERLRDLENHDREQERPYANRLRQLIW